MWTRTQFRARLLPLRLLGFSFLTMQALSDSSHCGSYPENASPASELQSTRWDSLIRQSRIPHLKSPLNDAIAWHYVMWFDSLEIIPYSNTSLLCCKEWSTEMSNQIVTGHPFVVSGAEFHVDQLLGFSWFMIQRQRWLNQKWSACWWHT